jgi:hypothetical protein
MPSITKSFYGTSAINIKSKALTATADVTIVPSVLWGYSAAGDTVGVIKDGSSGAVLAYVDKGETVMFGKPIEASTGLHWTETAGNIVVYYE